MPQSFSAALALTAATALPLAVPTPVPTPTGPQLSIAIDDGRPSARDGDRLTYVITVRNLGAAAAPGLAVSQSIPSGLTVSSADHGGTVHGGQIMWTVTVKPGETAKLTSIGTLGATGPQLLRLASVACAAPRAGQRATVCATDSDLLPAGAAATAPRRPASASRLPWVISGAVAAVLVTAAAFVVIRRRRKPLAPPARRGRTKVGATRE